MIEIGNTIKILDTTIQGASHMRVAKKPKQILNSHVGILVAYLTDKGRSRIAIHNATYKAVQI
jgi:hypothetical protein